MALEIGEEIRHFEVQDASRAQHTQCFFEHLDRVFGVLQYVGGIDDIEGCIGERQGLAFHAYDALGIEAVGGEQLARSGE